MSEEPTTAVTILVVEDDPSSRELLEQILEDAGYKVVSCADGREALTTIRRVRPRLVVSDLSMPRVDGLELCRAIRSDPELKSLPILFVSATEDMRRKLQAFDLGGNGFLEKPVDEAALLHKIESLLTMQGVRESMSKRGGRSR